jgi:hypothetical protein
MTSERKMTSDEKKTTRAIAEKLEVSNAKKTEAGLEDTIVHILLATRQENAPGTPDFDLAQYLLDCLEDYEKGKQRWTETCWID